MQPNTRWEEQGRKKILRIGSDNSLPMVAVSQQLMAQGNPKAPLTCEPRRAGSPSALPPSGAPTGLPGDLPEGT